MRVNLQKKCIWLTGASATAIMFSMPAAIAQDADNRRLDTVLVTTQKTEESIQDVPIAVSAFDEDALEDLQLAGGADLVKSIPNVAFSKGNFTGYNFKIRGIGVDLVAQSGDAGVGVHQNDVPLTANRLFEAEFYDVERVETLRGPQGTLYGRNATGGVINVITAKPVLEEFQADARLELGNENTIKAKGMVNLPIGDRAALRLAGSYLTRDGYATNSVTGNDIDDRDLYGIRATLAFEPTDRLRGWISYDYFEEDDNRSRVTKQLCQKDPFETSFAGIDIDAADQLYTSLGCQDAPLDQSNDRVNSAATLGGGLAIAAGLLSGDAFTDPVNPDLRVIESAFDPIYQADQELLTVKGEYDLTDALTATAIFSYTESSILSIEDYNKIAPTVEFNDLSAIPAGVDPGADLYNALFPGGVVSDPQLGSSNLFRTFDLSGGGSEQTTFELRVQSDNDGPFNFNLGAIYLDFSAIDPDTNTDGYYVLSNSLTGLTQFNNASGGSVFGGQVPIDPGGLFDQSLTGQGGNYFRSLSPYSLESFAVFGEGYFDVTDDVQLTVGLRYTDDQKAQDNTPTLLFVPTGTAQNDLSPVPVAGAAPDDAGDGTFNVAFEEVTGRIGFDWTPDFGFTDDSLLYAFYSRGYKGGGINPPQPAGNPNAFPQTFDPEFIDAFEIGTKNSIGPLQVNATAFYYDYQGYQITQIINRTSANFNIDAELQGFELESLWSPVENMLLNLNLGILDTEIQDTFAIDVLDRANGRDDIVVLKNAVNFANCAVSAAGYATVLGAIDAGLLAPGDTAGLCLGSFVGQEGAFGLTAADAVSAVDSEGQLVTYDALTPFDGEAKDISGNSIPNAPDMTLNFGGEYTFVSLSDTPWDLTLRADYYMQDSSFSRVWNTPRDELDSWDNLNLTLKLYNTDNDLSVELFGKNVTDEEVITGAYLTDDSSGLFTNIFLTEPRTYGIAVSKSW
ncbi:MAG: TonB-dependent receptor [Pseudomonadota bacterium]